MPRSPEGVERRRAADRALSPERRARKSEAERQRNAANPDRARGYHMARFGITVADYEALLEAQGGVCAICSGLPGARRLHVDHDHACCDRDGSCGACVRGLLCYACNAGLGYLRDNLSVLASAMAYLVRPPLGADPLPAATT